MLRAGRSAGGWRDRRRAAPAGGQPREHTLQGNGWLRLAPAFSIALLGSLAQLAHGMMMKPLRRDTQTARKSLVGSLPVVEVRGLLGERMLRARWTDCRPISATGRVYLIMYAVGSGSASLDSTTSPGWHSSWLVPQRLCQRNSYAGRGKAGDDRSPTAKAMCRCANEGTQ